jgi:hypothetical protein
MKNKCICGKDVEKRISIENGETFIECCSKCSNKIKAEMLEIRENQSYRQGKSRRQYSTSLILVMSALVSMIVIGVIFLIGKLFF